MKPSTSTSTSIESSSCHELNRDKDPRQVLLQSLLNSLQNEIKDLIFSSFSPSDYEISKVNQKEKKEYKEIYNKTETSSETESHPTNKTKPEEDMILRSYIKRKGLKIMKIQDEECNSKISENFIERTLLETLENIFSPLIEKIFDSLSVVNEQENEGGRGQEENIENSAEKINISTPSTVNCVSSMKGINKKPGMKDKENSKTNEMEEVVQKIAKQTSKKLGLLYNPRYGTKENANINSQKKLNLLSFNAADYIETLFQILLSFCAEKIFANRYDAFLIDPNNNRCLQMKNDEIFYYYDDKEENRRMNEFDINFDIELQQGKTIQDIKTAQEELGRKQKELKNRYFIKQGLLEDLGFSYLLQSSIFEKSKYKESLESSKTKSRIDDQVKKDTGYSEQQVNDTIHLNVDDLDLVKLSPNKKVRMIFDVLHQMVCFSNLEESNINRKLKEKIEFLDCVIAICKMLTRSFYDDTCGSFFIHKCFDKVYLICLHLLTNLKIEASLSNLSTQERFSMEKSIVILEQLIEEMDKIVIPSFLASTLVRALHLFHEQCLLYEREVEQIHNIIKDMPKHMDTLHSKMSTAHHSSVSYDKVQSYQQLADEFNRSYLNFLKRRLCYCKKILGIVAGRLSELLLRPQGLITILNCFCNINQITSISSMSTTGKSTSISNKQPKIDYDDGKIVTADGTEVSIYTVVNKLIRVIISTPNSMSPEDYISRLAQQMLPFYKIPSSIFNDDLITNEGQSKFRNYSPKPVTDSAAINGEKTKTKMSTNLSRGFSGLPQKQVNEESNPSVLKGINNKVPSPMLKVKEHQRDIHSNIKLDIYVMVLLLYSFYKKYPIDLKKCILIPLFHPLYEYGTTQFKKMRKDYKNHLRSLSHDSFSNPSPLPSASISILDQSHYKDSIVNTRKQEGKKLIVEVDPSTSLQNTGFKHLDSTLSKEDLSLRNRGETSALKNKEILDEKKSKPLCND